MSVNHSLYIVSKWVEMNDFGVHYRKPDIGIRMEAGGGGRVHDSGWR